MIVIDDEQVELSTSYGPMRPHIARPAPPGKYPGIVFFTEIFQVTGPIRRTAAMVAGHGYIVAIPEIYHEFEAAGTVLAYDQAGSDRGNALKTTKELASFDATDIHKGSLGKGMKDDSLQRAKDIKGELLMIWGRQDPHVPLEGRMRVLARLNEVNAKFSWHEVNGAHAFMRDEGIRYDPELAYQLYGLVFDFFHRRLGSGDLTVPLAGAGETKH